MFRRRAGGSLLGLVLAVALVSGCGEEEEPSGLAPADMGEADEGGGQDADAVEDEPDAVVTPDAEDAPELPPEDMIEDPDLAEDAADVPVDMGDMAPEDMRPGDGPGEDDIFTQPDVGPEGDAPEDFAGECDEDNPCEDGVCALGSCVDASPCFSDAQCLGGALGARVCAGCFAGDCEGGGACRAACEEDGQCGEGERCVDGGCAARAPLGCDADADCAGAQRCDPQAYVCVDGGACASDLDCAGGRLCDSGLGACVECRSNLDCEGFQSCQRSPFGATCAEPGRCSTDDDCLGLRICDGQSGRCASPICAEDRLEPNNRINEDIRMLREGVQTGLRLCNGEADLFLVTSRADQALWARTRSEGGPVQILLYPGGANPFDPIEPLEPVAVSSGDGETQGLVIPAEAQGRTWLLRLTSDQGGVQGYALEISLSAPPFAQGDCPQDEPNASAGRATPLVAGAPTEATLCAAPGEADEDWYRASLPAGRGGELALVFQGEAPGVTVWRQDGEALAQEAIQARAEGFGASLSLPASEVTQSWFVRLERQGAAQEVLLDLREVEAVACEDMYEPNDAPEGASALAFEGPLARVEAAQVCAGDVDYYRWAAPGGVGLQIDLTRPEGAPGLTPLARLLRADLSPVGVARPAGDGLRLALGEVPVGGAEYLLEVQSAGALAASYDVEVAQVAPFCAENDALEPSDAANPVPIYAPALDATLCAGEEDVYVLDTADREQLLLELEGAEGVVFDVRRQDNNLALIQGARRFQERLASGGALRVTVRGATQTSSGAYTLRSSGRAQGPENQRCAGAIPLAVGEVARGRLSGADDAASSAGCFTLGGSPDVVYRLQVERGGPLVVRVRPLPGPGAPAPAQVTVFARSICDDMQSERPDFCADDFQDMSPGDGVVTLNQRFDPGDVYLWVDGTLDGALGDFEIQVEAP